LQVGHSTNENLSLKAYEREDYALARTPSAMFSSLCSGFFWFDLLLAFSQTTRGIRIACHFCYWKCFVVAFLLESFEEIDSCTNENKLFCQIKLFVLGRINRQHY
jgi:hypothetical protein